METYENNLIKEIIQKAVSDTRLSEERIKAKDAAWQNRGQAGKAVVDALININNRLQEGNKK